MFTIPLSHPAGRTETQGHDAYPKEPGEQIEVDWAGDPAHLIDPYTGEIIDTYIFIGVMAYSQYTYAEAIIDEKQSS